MNRPKFTIYPFLLLLLILTTCNATDNKSQSNDQDRASFLADLQERTFHYFWDLADPKTGLIPDRAPTKSFSSIAAIGFGLVSYIVGVENGYISRQQASQRVNKTLKFLFEAPQGPEKEGSIGYRGFFYHFLDMRTGTRFKQVELSTIDTGLLMAGVLTCQSYFNGTSEEELDIRAYADSLYLRVDWGWAMNNNATMSMGWHPETGFIESSWQGYNEAMILLVLGLGSPTHPIPAKSWEVWTSTYEWANFMGYDYVNFGPLFGHQYSHLFIDFRGIKDEYMKSKGIDYFINSQRATLANRAYCIDNKKGFLGYNANTWGLTASDGPFDGEKETQIGLIEFATYQARAAAANDIQDDGTIAPTAAGGSIAFTPDESIKALMSMKDTYGEKIYGQYGFYDAFNLTYPPSGWFDNDYLGIDQGPILIQAENYKTNLIWNINKQNSYVKAGLIRAGFTNGWLLN